MEQARHLQDQPQQQAERKPVTAQELRRSEPQPLDEELLRQIGGGTDAPRGNW